MFYARWTIDELTETTAAVLVSSAQEGTAVTMSYRWTDGEPGARGIDVRWHEGLPEEATLDRGSEVLALYEGGPMDPVMAAPPQDAATGGIVEIERRALDDIWTEQRLVLERAAVSEVIRTRTSDSFRLPEDPTPEPNRGALRVERVAPVERDVREGDVFWVEHENPRVYELLLRGNVSDVALRAWDVTAVTRRLSKALFEDAVTQSEAGRGQTGAR